MVDACDGVHDASGAAGRMRAVATVLFIEDDRAIRAALRLALEDEGYDVREAGDGRSGLADLASGGVDVVLLDLRLPDMSGFDVCREIRSSSQVPVIMVTAQSDTHDLVAGLEAGADDYLTKPFSGRELVARVRALLRRTRGADVTADAGPLRLGPWRIDPATRTATAEGRECHLTPTEFDLLVHLARRPGHVFTREDLLAGVWGYRDGSGARTVDSHVRALRRKLGAETIRTVHGVGYAAARTVAGAAA